MEPKITSADQSAFSITGSLVDISKGYTIANESNGLWATGAKYILGTPLNLLFATVGAIEWTLSTSLLIAGKFLEIASLFLISRNLSKWIHRVVVEPVSSYTLSTTLAVCFAASRVVTNFLGERSVYSTESAIKNYVTPFFKYSTARRVNNQFRTTQFNTPYSPVQTPAPTRARVQTPAHTPLNDVRHPTTFSGTIRHQYENLSQIFSQTSTDKKLLIAGCSAAALFTLNKYPAETMIVATLVAYWFCAPFLGVQEDDIRIVPHEPLPVDNVAGDAELARQLQQEEGLRNPVQELGDLHWMPAEGALTPRPARGAAIASPADNHPLRSAAFRRNSVEIARITSGINESDEEGNTALHWALKTPITNQFDCDRAIAALNALFEKGAGLSVENQRGLTPFQVAVQAQKAHPRALPVLQLLLNQGADRYIKSDSDHSLASTEEPEFVCGIMKMDIENHLVLDPTDGKTVYGASEILQALKRKMESPMTRQPWPCNRNNTPLFLEAPHIAENITPPAATREANKRRFALELQNFHGDRRAIRAEDEREVFTEVFGNWGNHFAEINARQPW